MENVIAIAAGLALRTVIDTLTDNDHRLTSTLIGLWEGIVLYHFLRKNPRTSSDAYLALATRFVIDFMLTGSIVRFALTGAWTVVGLLLADIAPTVWRSTGLRHVYRALRKDVKAMRRAMPRWRIENDIKVPNISISNNLFSRPPPSTTVSSTRAAPPTSPVSTLDRRPPSGTPASQVASSDVNSLTREVRLGPSPAFIPTAVDPVSFDSHSHSQRTSLLSNNEPDPSILHPILVPGDDRVHIAPPSSPEEQEQSQDPELSALDISPPVPELEVTAVNLEIISPTPVMGIRALPIISDIDISVPAHQVPLPPSAPASRVNTPGTTTGWRGNFRALANRVGSDIGPDFGKAYHQRSSSIGGFGQGQSHLADNRPGSTGHQRIDSSSRRRERSTLRLSEENKRRGMIEPAGDSRARTEPSLPGVPGTESFVGGFVIRAPSQTSQPSTTPQARSGSGNMRADSVIGLTTSHLPAPTPSKSMSTTLVPPIKPPTPARQASTSHTRSDNAGAPLKTPTPVPQSKDIAPKPKSDSSDPTSATNPLTDYNPAEPIRPLIRSPSTVRDSIFGGNVLYASNDLDTGEYDLEPPPMYESPVKSHGEGLGATDGGGPSVEPVIESAAEGKRQEGDTEGDRQQTTTDRENGEVSQVVQTAGEGEQGLGETSQGTGGDPKGAGENTTKLEESAQEKLGDTREQEKIKQDEMKGDEGAGGDNQGARNDIQESDKIDEGILVAVVDTQVASGDTQVADPGEDSSSKPIPTLLTPEQKEAETHRAAFLRKAISQLEESKLKSKKTDLPEIQARVDVLEGRIARTNFTDPPEHPPVAPELSTTGCSVSDILDQLTTMIVNLVIERQDVAPIQVRVSSSSKSKKKDVEKGMKTFITENGFSISSDTANPFAIVITV